MLLLELTHTAHTAASTGIQQVCRNLFFELGDKASAIVHDPWQGVWRAAEGAELVRLSPCEEAGAARRKSEAWSFNEKLRGRLRMLAGRKGLLPQGADAVLFPEFVMGRCLRALPQLRMALGGRVPFLAVFHDAIALKMPELSAKKTVERYPEYLATLAKMDAVAAVSEASRRELLALWRDMGIADAPPVDVIALGIAKPEPLAVASRSVGMMRVLCVSTLEPRKNHLALLDAAELLWREGCLFELHLVGMAHRELGGQIVDRIENMKAAGRPIVWHGSVDGAALRRAYAECDFTAYCSLNEGFGLPVLESLSYGKPCLCTTCGALDEVSRGGGCLRLSGVDAITIANGLGRMLREDGLLRSLQVEAGARPLRTWADYARDIAAWSGEIRPRG